MSVAAWPLSRVLPHIPLGAVADSLMMYRFNVDQYLQMIDAGILPEDGSYELLNGVILKKDNGTLGDDDMGHKPPHALVVTLLSVLIARINGPNRHLRIQLPVVLSNGDAPEPDGSIVRGTPRDYSDRLPTAGDTFCVIEVAHSSLERDKGEKMPAYAAAGIPQYVLINLRNNSIELHSRPDKLTGEYESKEIHELGDFISINLGDGETLDLPAAELLP